MVPDLLAGIRVTTKEPTHTHTHPVSRDALEYVISPTIPRSPWSTVPAFNAQAPTTPADPTAQWKAAAKILRDANATTRSLVLKDLGLAAALQYYGVDCSQGYLSPPQISA